MAANHLMPRPDEASRSATPALHPMAGASIADPLGGVLPPPTPVLLRDRLARGVIRVLLAMLFRVHVEGSEQIPTGRPVICAANHLSWLDPFLLLALLPLAPRRYAVGNAANTLTPPWRRKVIAPFHTLIPLDRTRPQAAIRTMETIVARGNTLIIFPEGQTGDEGRVLPLQSGTAYLAQRTGCPILTVGITGSGDLWLRKRITVRFGRCVDPASAAGESPHARRDALLAAVHGQIEALLVRQPRHRGPRLLRRTLTGLF